MKNLIKPDFEIEVMGFNYSRRGCNKSGWSTGSDIYYRCAKCGSFMPASINKDFACECGSMYLDIGYARFGSRYGDDNILVYRKTNDEVKRQKSKKSSYNTRRIILGIFLFIYAVLFIVLWFFGDYLLPIPPK